MARFVQGYYTLKNPHKYIGDPSKVRYMSSYELEMHKFLDNNERVLHWGSEEIAIPYIKPTDGKVHKYYVDYFVEYINKDGEIVKELIEVKPFKETHKPRKQNLYEQITFAINVAKWQAATLFAKQQGWKFRIITEKSIFK